MPGHRNKKEKIILSNKYGFTLCQQNGQRTYGGPPPNWGSRPPPSRESEVFIGRLPRMCFEDELIPLFLSVGELYEFRLMLDFSGTNRGYGYAHYATPEGAQRAIEKLNKYEIRPGHLIGVLRSKNNCRLLFGNIGSALNVDTFNEFIRTTTDQVLNVLMFENFDQLKQTDFRISTEVEEAFLGRMPRNNGSNQFAIVEYENHKAAAVARRVLIPKYGHILAIDWAVPPRERKRFGPGTESQLPAIEGSFPTVAVKDSNVFLVSKSGSKVRPVPILLVQPSPLDNVPFMPKTFKTVVKFFKYQLSVCLYKSVDQLEIPLFICKEIERKIVDRITNLENCSQAVQLIFNYFSWYNEKKRIIINTEAQELLQEVKVYADSFVFFVNKRLKYGPSQNPAEDSYFIHILPLQLNILFRIILRSDAVYQAKLSSGISKGLKWLMEVMQKGNRASKGFIEEIINLVKNEDGNSLDKASSLAKTLLLNTITSHQETQNLLGGFVMDFPLQETFSHKNTENSNEVLSENVINQLDKNYRRPRMTSVVPSTFSTFQTFASDLNQFLKDSSGHYIPMPFSQLEKVNQDMSVDSNVCPPVPLLMVQPSIMNKIPFMPEVFNNVLIYFKHLIRVCLNVSVWQTTFPPHVADEIERKIVDRISNLENCGQGVQLILSYFSSWAKTRAPSKSKSNSNFSEVQKLLQEVKIYSESFVNFVWSKTTSVYIPNETVEDYFCKILPLRLSLLFHIMLLFSSEHPMRSLIGITKGLHWLESLIQKGGKDAQKFLEEMTRFILDLDPSAYERARNVGRAFCMELMSSNGKPIEKNLLLPYWTADGQLKRISDSGSHTDKLSGFGGSDSAPDDILDCP